MKKYLIAVAVILALALACSASEGYEPRNGDIIFHESRSTQSRAIQLVTGSKYSHMGIVHLVDNEPFVFEAAGFVRSTHPGEWVARGRCRHFVIKRLHTAESVLDQSALRRMLAIGRGFEGKPYDLYFEWSDDRIYCSELVWKVYQRGLGIELTEPQTIADFDLDHPEVRTIVRSRWPQGPPLDQKVISPVAIFESEQLVTVYEN